MSSLQVDFKPITNKVMCIKKKLTVDNYWIMIKKSAVNSDAIILSRLHQSKLSIVPHKTITLSPSYIVSK